MLSYLNKKPILKTWLLTTLAMLAFAANSIFCRLALKTEQIDATGFTLIRLLSGAIFLAVLVFYTQQRTLKRQLSHAALDSAKVSKWPAIFQLILKPSLHIILSAFCLFLYAASFSFAYIKLDAGMGALILFGAVQLSMLFYTIFMGQRLKPTAMIGLVMAFSGLVYVLYPNLSLPSFDYFVLMLLSGLAWAGYTLLGKVNGAKESVGPLLSSYINFVYSVPFVVLLSIFYWPEIYVSPSGLLYAVLSGALASGAGYAIWYKALEGLTATEAGIVQLSVPIIALFAGVILLNEVLTLRLIIAASLLVWGLYLVIRTKN